MELAWRGGQLFGALMADEGEEGYKAGGYHRVRIGDTYNDRYKVVEKLGWGHFSTVWLVDDLTLPVDAPLRRVALKIQKSARRYTQAAQDEIKLLDCVNEKMVARGGGASRVVKLLDSFTTSGPNGDHVCFVFETLGDNLLRVIKHYNYEGLPIDVVKFMVYHILEGLDYLHRVCRIIHTDLKPENVLVCMRRAEAAAAGSGGGAVATAATTATAMAAVAASSDAAVDEVTEMLATLVPFVSPPATDIESSVGTPSIGSPIGSPASAKAAAAALDVARCTTLDAAIEAIDAQLEPGSKISPSSRKRMKKKRAKFKAQRARVLGDPGALGAAGAAVATAVARAAPTPTPTSTLTPSAAADATPVAAAPSSIEPYFRCEDEVEVKIVDLGNACWIDRHFSEDIQTRQYRCPEVREPSRVQPSSRAERRAPRHCGALLLPARSPPLSLRARRLFLGRRTAPRQICGPSHAWRLSSSPAICSSIHTRGRERRGKIRTPGTTTILRR